MNIRGEYRVKVESDHRAGELGSRYKYHQVTISLTGIKIGEKGI